MISLISTTLLPYLVIFLLIPLVMLLVGKAFGVISDKLKYPRLLLITFVGSLLGGFARELHPYAMVGVFFVVVLWMIKKQIDTSWGKALTMTLGGLIVAGVLSYGANYFLLKNLVNTSAQIATKINDEKGSNEISKIERTAAECFKIGEEEAGKKFKNYRFDQMDFMADRGTNNGDGHSNYCKLSYINEEGKSISVEIQGDKTDSKMYDFLTPEFRSMYPDRYNPKIIDSPDIIAGIKNDIEFKEALNAYTLKNPGSAEKEIIRMLILSFDKEFKKYVWKIDIGDILSEKEVLRLLVDAQTGEIIKKLKFKFNEETKLNDSFIFIDGKWVNPNDAAANTKDDVKTEITTESRKPKLPSQ